MFLDILVKGYRQNLDSISRTFPKLLICLEKTETNKHTESKAFSDILTVIKK